MYKTIADANLIEIHQEISEVQVGLSTLCF